MVYNTFDNFTRLSAYGMVGIGEGTDLFYDALRAVLEMEELSSAMKWSGLGVDELIRDGFWLFSLVLADTVPEDETLVEEVGSPEGLACAAAVAWAVARRYVGGNSSPCLLRRLMKGSPLVVAMKRLVEKCDEVPLNSIMPQSHNTAAEQPGSTRRSHQSRAKQHDPLPNTARPLPVMAEHLVVNVTNNFYENSCHFGAGSTQNGDVNLSQLTHQQH